MTGLIGNVHVRRSRPTSSPPAASGFNVLPLSRPILGVVALLAVIASWKDYLWPLLVLPNPDLQPVSLALPKIAAGSELNIQMAGLFFALLIPVVLFIVFQRSFLRGVGMAGGVKG
ncbi:hypothetical protein [Nonomuraea sp. NPDC049784]|uniref:hypothetical protein n=1 Tax=Nonomuraea sp. NPDC049784 TaxID=3154361 RepID=UPI0033F3FE11